MLSINNEWTESYVAAEMIIGEAQDASRLRDLLTPTAADLGFVLVRLRFLSRDDRRTLQILAEYEDGTMDVGGCTKLSRAFSAVLDVEDPISGAYDLEVSSPGIDRPLARVLDFDRFEGFEIKLETKMLIGGRKRFRGTCEGSADGEVLLRMALKPGEEPQVLGFAPDMIADAKIVITDELLQNAAKAKKEKEDAAETIVDVDETNLSDG